MMTDERSAAYNAQMDTLRLKPWQDPPCAIADPDTVIAAGAQHPDFATARLCKRMARYDISPFDHDPAAAIERAKAKK